MTKRFKKILGISIVVALMIGGLVLALGTPFDHFLTHDDTKVSKTDQIAYLKKHEKEMTDYVKSQNLKVTSVQWDWESVKVETVQPNAGGIPTGDKYNEMTIEGKVNNIDNSGVGLKWQLSIKQFYPKISAMNLWGDISYGKRID